VHQGVQVTLEATMGRMRAFTVFYYMDGEIADVSESDDFKAETPDLQAKVTSNAASELAALASSARRVAHAYLRRKVRQIDARRRAV
jgi:hypothetical protein